MLEVTANKAIWLAKLILEVLLPNLPVMGWLPTWTWVASGTSPGALGGCDWEDESLGRWPPRHKGCRHVPWIRRFNGRLGAWTSQHNGGEEIVTVCTSKERLRAVNEEGQLFQRVVIMRKVISNVVPFSKPGSPLMSGDPPLKHNDTPVQAELDRLGQKNWWKK